MHSKKQKFLLALLALFCVLGAELAVCRVAAPEVFQQITSPFQNAFHTVVTAIQDFSHHISARQETTNQAASPPAIQSELMAENPAITRFSTENGQEVLTGGTLSLVYYNQGEAPWKDMSYGTDHIGGYGCGPTAMAMVVSSLTENTVNPGEMAQWSAEQGYCAPGCGSYHTLIQAAAAAYGLSLTQMTSLDADQLLQALSSGCVFVALMTRGHFTSNGHFIVLRGVTMDGRVLVADPNSRARSLTAWEPQLILEELSPNTSGGGPLWCFLVPPTL